jgi:hypothetical protein
VAYRVLAPSYIQLLNAFGDLNYHVGHRATIALSYQCFYVC